SRRQSVLLGWPAIRVVSPIRPPIVSIGCRESFHRFCPDSSRSIRQFSKGTEAERFMIRAIFDAAASRLRAGLGFDQMRRMIVGVAAVKGAVGLHQILREVYSPVSVVLILRTHDSADAEAGDLKSRIVTGIQAPAIAITKM